MSSNRVTKGTQKRISPDLIDPNPENPRVIFSERNEKALLESIDEEGVIVPLIVYKDDGRYRLLDGERRLRCARRLNLRDVPVNIITKPTPVQNILQMFHIHNVKRAWELIETAQKLDQILKEPGFQEKHNKDIAKLTGLSPSTVKRCRDLLALPQMYRRMIVDTYARIASGREIDADRRMTEDFFLESRLAINSIKKNLPELYDQYGDPLLLDKFVTKRKAGGFSNVLQVGHMIPKIVLSARKGAPRGNVLSNIKRLIEDPSFSIQQAYDSIALPILTTTNIQKKCLSLIEDLQTFEKLAKLRRDLHGEKLKPILQDLRSVIDVTLSTID